MSDLELRKRRMPRWQDIVAAFIICAVIVSGTTIIIWQQALLAGTQTQDGVQNSVIQQQQSTINKLREQILKLGETPAASAPSQSEIDKATSPGPAGATGAKGDKGDPGQNATDSQVTDAVQDYCASHGGCIGAPGQTGAAGAPGANGADSTVPGPQGPQGDPGPIGPPGPAGANGTDGRGITSVTCQDDGTWLITYTDGTTSATQGPCKIGLL
jgi:hypothetical protein